MFFSKSPKSVKPSLHVVMHVPKTGGASISHGLQKTFGTERVLRCEWFDQLVKHSKENGLSGYSALICHIAGRELPYLTDDFNLNLSTFLRDPVVRVFSNYCFWREVSPDVRLDVGCTGQVPLVDLTLDWKEDLARVLSRAPEIWKYRELVDVSTWQFATSMYERTGRSNSKALTEAKKRLKSMALVGFQENLQEDYQRLVSHIDETAVPSPLGKINQTKKQGGPVLDQEIRALISTYNPLDMELYEWARSVFLKRS